MMNTSTKMGKDENTEQYPIQSLESEEEKSEQTLVINVGRTRIAPTPRELFLQKVHNFHYSIPKHITTFDEKYILHCLELIRNSALRTSVNFVSKVDILPAGVNSHNMAVESPFPAGNDVFIHSSGGDWPVGAVSGSRSMINILKSPLLQQFGSLESDSDFSRNLLDVTEPVYSDFTESPPQESISHKLENEVSILDRKQVSLPIHRRVFSISSTTSSFSDNSSSSIYASSFQGMLQCTWKNGLPAHVFSVDDKKEVYVAKVEMGNDKVLDYVYSFNSRKYGKKENEVHENELENVGKMRVSTSITLCSDNSEVKETQFVLSVANDNPNGETQISSHAVKKSKRLTRKVVDVFRASHSYKQRSYSKFGGSNAIYEDTPWEPSEDVHDSGEGSEGDKYVPNLEMAAIIVKEIGKNRKEEESGGWGLKFLKSSGKGSRPSGNSGECSTSMSVLIPAGFHGGPRARVGGPSTLTERWISGGQCDCGGWDLGCPLTILNINSNSTDFSSKMENFGECKSIDLFMQGSKQDVPVMKMVNIHEGLYYIHFQSTLSTLQSFAIATAIFHTQSPFLRSKVYRS